MPTVAAQPYALTTVAELLAYMGEPPDTTGTQADRAQRLINAYSAAINRYTKRVWKPVETGDKLYSYSGNGYLSLAPYEARAINTVTLYTDLATDSWVVLDNQSATQAAGWRPGPRGKSRQGTYWYLLLPELGRFNSFIDYPLPTPSNQFDYEVTVNADWGVSDTDIPDDLELACWIACANAWTNPGGHRSRQLGPLSTSDFDGFVPGTEEGLALPRASRALLTDYRRKTGVR